MQRHLRECAPVGGVTQRAVLALLARYFDFARRRRLDALELGVASDALAFGCVGPALQRFSIQDASKGCADGAGFHETVLPTRRK